MKYRGDKKFVYWGLTAFLVIAASLGFYYFLFYGDSLKSGFGKLIAITMPILDGLLLAYLMTPILNSIEKRMMLPLCKKMKMEGIDSNKRRKGLIRMISIILTLIFVGVITYEFFLMVIPQIINSVQSIVGQFPEYVDQVITWAQKVLSDNPDAENFVINMLDKYSVELERFLNTTVLPQMNAIVRTVSLSLLGVLKALWNLIIGLIISIYIMASKEMFAGQGKKILYALFERKTANIIIHDLRFTHRTFSGFISGKILDSAIIGVLCFIGTSLIGTPYPVLISVIVGVTNIIPFFGPYFGAVPSALLILMIDPIQCIYFIIFILFLQQLDGNFIGPMILGDSTGLSGFWVIFAITLFGGLFGVFGMIIGVPVFAVVFAGIKAIVSKSLKHKNMPIGTEHYIPVGFVARDMEFVRYEPAPSKKKKNGAAVKEEEGTEADTKEGSKPTNDNHTFVIYEEDHMEEKK